MSPRKKTEARYPKATEFLLSVANSVSGGKRISSTVDVAQLARRVAQYVAARLDAEDVDSVLEVLDEALRHEPDSGPAKPKPRPDRSPRQTPGERYQQVDPHFWG